MGRKQHLDQLREFKREINRTTPVEKMILFGSRAHGRPRRWSDFDIIIVSRKFTGQRFRNRSLSLRDYWKLNYPVDFLCYSPQEFRRLRREPSIVAEAIRTGVEV